MKNVCKKKKAPKKTRRVNICVSLAHECVCNYKYGSERACAWVRALYVDGWCTGLEGKRSRLLSLRTCQSSAERNQKESKSQHWACVCWDCLCVWNAFSCLAIPKKQKTSQMRDVWKRGIAVQREATLPSSGLSVASPPEDTDGLWNSEGGSRLCWFNQRNMRPTGALRRFENQNYNRIVFSSLIGIALWVVYSVRGVLKENLRVPQCEKTEWTKESRQKGEKGEVQKRLFWQWSETLHTALLRFYCHLTPLATKMKISRAKTVF